MNSEAAGTEWIPLLKALKAANAHMVAEYVQAGGDEEAKTNPNMIRFKRLLKDTEAAIKLAEARPVPQPATEPLILANLTKHEFERLSHGRIPYSGAAGDPHYDKDPRPWGFATNASTSVQILMLFVRWKKTFLHGPPTVLVGQR